MGGAGVATGTGGAAEAVMNTGGAALTAAGAGNVGRSAGPSASGATGGAGDLVNGGGTGVGSVRPKLRTVGYLPSYRGALSTWATSLDFSRVSYVNVCFATLDASGNVSYPDATLSTFLAAAHKAGSKVCMALGGATTITDFGAFAAQIAPANRAAFVQKIANYTVSTGLDCIDVDFEGNGVNADYEGFVSALAAALKAQGKETTAALASWFGEKVTSNALQAFDFVNVMAYDLHNPGGNATPVQSSSLADAKTEVDYWIGRGLSKDKAVFGVPFYGYRWKPGATAGEAIVYAELLSKYGAAAANDSIVQDGMTIYLNSKATIMAKTQLAAQYGGVMVWELGQDASGTASLLRAMGDAQN